MPRQTDLLTDIERGALDDSTPLASVLRKCVALGGATRSAELRDWASQELDGYRDDDSKIPAYRIVYAPIQIDGINMRFQVKGQQISVTDLPDFAQEGFTNEVKLAFGVGHLEALVRDAERDGDKILRMAPHGAPELVKYMNLQDRDAYIERVYWGVSTGSVSGVLDHIRTTLVRLIGEMRSTMDNSSTLPSQEDAAQAVSVVLRGGKRHNITINTIKAQDNANIGMQSPSAAEESGWSKTATISAIIGVVVAVIAGYFAYRQWRG